MRFVFVHGGFHGAWCWERLVHQLEERGHAAVAIDLPGHGARVGEEPSLADYRDAVVDVIEAGDVLVGHSMGGFVATMAADAAVDRVRHVVYLAAGLPVEGQPMQTSSNDALSNTTMLERVDDGRRMQFLSAEAATDFFYHDCPADLARWACSMLTPQPLAVFGEPISVPRFWEAELPRSFIRCRQDRAGHEAAGDRTATRLGVESFWIDTSHSPFLSQPTTCAELVVEATKRPPTGPLIPR